MATAALIEPAARAVGSAPPASGVADTLILSDLHLGLPIARPRDVLRLLEGWRYDRLILLGDIFHDWNVRHLCADTWRLLAHIRRLSLQNRTEVVWVVGNHDRHLAQLVARLLGIRTTECFRWTYAGRSFVAVHGDCFDSFVTRYGRLADFFSGIYAFAHRWLSRGGRWPMLLDRLHIGLTALCDEVEKGARSFASTNGFDVIVCGHTHTPRHRVFDVSGPAGRSIEYYNTGCWVGRSATYVTVSARGVLLNACP